MSKPVAIVTGAGSGIGQATAIALSHAGFRVVLAGRNQNTLQSTAKQIPDSLVVVTDITNAVAAENLIARSLESFGRIDALINNAGYLVVKPIAEMSDAEWQATIDTNLTSAFRLSRAVWPIFAKQKSGVIVNISSPAATDPFAGLGAYGTAKAGVVLMGVALSREAKPIGVRVYTVSPHATETAMFRQIVSREQFSPDLALDPKDVAKVIVACVQNDPQYARQHATGEVIEVRKSQ